MVISHGGSPVLRRYGGSGVLLITLPSAMRERCGERKAVAHDSLPRQAAMQNAKRLRA
ncbi:hypothetical protein AtDm6_1846 [Acetobacter tropicalis]|uniref:Uncharacterized protein n=2 Tax=Acetobacter tropicalis TaxID=104102 RepID=F7VEU4_9PROT|nr:hypothetical protein AtDm6_1846 [Acetobacter tropicalis]GAA08889.1 hypothetical protein ATPR_1893 [Acetobacter tropicalis NBRC 101654]